MSSTVKRDVQKLLEEFVSGDPIRALALYVWANSPIGFEMLNIAVLLDMLRVEDRASIVRDIIDLDERIGLFKVESVSAEDVSLSAYVASFVDLDVCDVVYEFVRLRAREVRESVLKFIDAFYREMTIAYPLFTPLVVSEEEALSRGLEAGVLRDVVYSGVAVPTWWFFRGCLLKLYTVPHCIIRRVHMLLRELGRWFAWK